LTGDPLPILGNIGLVLLLVLLNGFFVAAEFAMVKVKGSRIDALAQTGHIRAKIARSITANLDAYLSACQLGITLSSLGLGWVGEGAIAIILEPLLRPFQLTDSVIHSVSFVAGFMIITALHITLGEQFPKRYAIRKFESFTLLSSIPLLMFYKIMSPFIWVLNGASGWLLKRAGIEPSAEQESAHTEDEIRILMKESGRNGHMDSTELALMDNIFDFAETSAREIMIPRTEMICLYAHTSFEANKTIAITEMHTRYPVCDPDKDNVIGFVHIKDLLRSDITCENLKNVTRPIMRVPELMPISNLLKLMQKKKSQMALLIDEYGGTSGLVTFEDIIEEIVGEIQDEFDEERPQIEKKDEITFSIDGRLLIEEVNSFFGLDMESDDYDTIGGWMYSQIEIPPKKNQKIYHYPFEFMIDETDHLRITRIVVRRMNAKPESDSPSGS
jgi:CBS domain containing-hemolysin-like protein